MAGREGGVVTGSGTSRSTYFVSRGDVRSSWSAEWVRVWLMCLLYSRGMLGIVQFLYNSSRASPGGGRTAALWFGPARRRLHSLIESLRLAARARRRTGTR